MQFHLAKPMLWNCPHPKCVAPRSGECAPLPAIQCELFALVFDASRPAVQDARLRQAISLAIDRASIADVILQRQGVPAGGLLPNWISGYAHLFPAASDLPRAKDLLAASGREHFRSMPLVLYL